MTKEAGSSGLGRVARQTEKEYFRQTKLHEETATSDGVAATAWGSVGELRRVWSYRSNRDMDSRGNLIPL